MIAKCPTNELPLIYREVKEVEIEDVRFDLHKNLILFSWRNFCGGVNEESPGQPLEIESPELFLIKWLQDLSRSPNGLKSLRVSNFKKKPCWRNSSENILRESITEKKEIFNKSLETFKSFSKFVENFLKWFISFFWKEKSRTKTLRWSMSFKESIREMDHEVFKGDSFLSKKSPSFLETPWCARIKKDWFASKNL